MRLVRSSQKLGDMIPVNSSVELVARDTDRQRCGVRLARQCQCRPSQYASQAVHQVNFPAVDTHPKVSWIDRSDANVTQLLELSVSIR